MNVLSLFDGISCGQVALGRAGITVDNYYASELDKYAIKVTQGNYPNTVQLGDVTKWREWDIDWASIDLLIGGSPCQGFSFAGRQLAFDDPRSALFFTYSDILNHIRSLNPYVKFLMENVKMKKEYLTAISEWLGVEPVFINSNLVSAQNRQRFYWTNWDFGQPLDNHVSFQDIKSNDFEYCNKFKVNKTPSRVRMWNNGEGNNSHHTCSNVTYKEKTNCITTKQDRSSNTGLIEHDGFCRYLTQLELERLQTLPDNYTKLLSYNQASKAIGNGWTVDVIAHIFNLWSD